MSRGGVLFPQSSWVAHSITLFFLSATLCRAAACRSCFFLCGLFLLSLHPDSCALPAAGSGSLSSGCKAEHVSDSAVCPDGLVKLYVELLLEIEFGHNLMLVLACVVCPLSVQEPDWEIGFSWVVDKAFQLFELCV